MTSDSFGNDTGGSSMAEKRRDFVADTIRRAALPLFAARGFDQVTVDDVAAAAGISQRTFFRYYASKDDVLLAYSRRLLERLCIALVNRPSSEGPVTALRAALIATSTTAPADRESIRLQASVLAHKPELRARAQGEQAASDGPLVTALAARMQVDALLDTRPALIAATLTGAAFLAFDRWVADASTDDPGARVAEAVDVVIAGVGRLDRPPGRSRR